jgi:hypothetical protein
VTGPNTDPIFNLRAPRELSDEIKRRAAEQDISASEMARRLLAAGLAQYKLRDVQAAI